MHYVLKFIMYAIKGNPLDIVSLNVHEVYSFFNRLISCNENSILNDGGSPQVGYFYGKVCAKITLIIIEIHTV